MGEVVYTVEDLTKMLQISESKVRQLIKSGDIEALKVGKQWRITPSALQDYLKTQTAQARKQR